MIQLDFNKCILAGAVYRIEHGQPLSPAYAKIINERFNQAEMPIPVANYLNNHPMGERTRYFIGAKRDKRPTYPLKPETAAALGKAVIMFQKEVMTTERMPKDGPVKRNRRHRDGDRQTMSEAVMEDLLNKYHLRFGFKRLYNEISEWRKDETVMRHLTRMLARYGRMKDVASS